MVPGQSTLHLQSILSLGLCPQDANFSSCVLNRIFESCIVHKGLVILRKINAIVEKKINLPLGSLSFLYHLLLCFTFGCVECLHCLCLIVFCIFLCCGFYINMAFQCLYNYAPLMLRYLLLFFFPFHQRTKKHPESVTVS